LTGDKTNLRVCSSHMTIDLIYLDNHGSNFTGDWKYYRVTPVFGMHIETCEVQFPSLTDKGVATQTPFIVGLPSAYDIKAVLLKSMGIDQDRAVLIGLRERP
jgi:hypothetical protein